MNTYLSSAELKDKAKEKLTGHYGLLIGTTLVIGLISLVTTFIITGFIPGVSTAALLLGDAISFIISVFVGVFSIGTTLLYMKFACGGEASFKDIFYGFSHNIQKSLTISLVLNAIGFLPTLAYTIPSRIFLSTGDEFYLYLALPLTAIALVIYVFISLTLSQCYYLMLDFPNKSAGELLKLSAKVMQGHKARLFYIEISFIPLYILAVLSCIGLFWVGPYMNMTLANFFFDIMKPEQKN